MYIIGQPARSPDLIVDKSAWFLVTFNSPPAPRELLELDFSLTLREFQIFIPLRALIIIITSNAMFFHQKYHEYHTEKTNTEDSAWSSSLLCIFTFIHNNLRKQTKRK